MQQLARLLGQNITVVILTLIIGVLTARALVPADRGIVALCMTFALFIANIIPWGSHIYLSRLSANDRTSIPTVYATAYRLAIIVGFLGFPLCWIMIIGLQKFGTIPQNIWLAFMTALIVPLCITNAYQTQIELGRGKISNFGRLRLITSAVQIACLVPSIYFFILSPLHFLSIFGFATLVSCAVGVFLIRSDLIATGIVRSDAPLATHATFRQSRKYGFAVVSSSLNQHIDKISAGLLFSASEIGVYYVAAGLAQVVHIVGDVFTQSMFVHAVSNQSGSSEQWQHIAKRMRITVLIYIIISVPAMAALFFLLPLLYGFNYQAGSPLLIALVPAALALSLNRNCEELIKGMGGTLLTLNLPLIPVFIITGASFAISGGTSLIFFSSMVLLAFAIGGFCYILALKNLSKLPARHFIVFEVKDIVFVISTLQRSIVKLRNICIR